LYFVANLLWTLVQNVSNTTKDYILNPSSETSSAKGLFQILVTDRAKNDDNNRGSFCNVA
jgi:hypothetical protein